jgi:hypothetical protein
MKVKLLEATCKCGGVTILAPEQWFQKLLKCPMCGRLLIPNQPNGDQAVYSPPSRKNNKRRRKKRPARGYLKWRSR